MGSRDIVKYVVACSGILNTIVAKCRSVGRGVSRGFRKPPVKFGLFSLQQEPNTLLSLATVSSL